MKKYLAAALKKFNVDGIRVETDEDAKTVTWINPIGCKLVQHLDNKKVSPAKHLADLGHWLGA